MKDEKVSMQKAILQFLVKHWKEILLILLSAGIFFKMQSDMNELQKAYDAAKESYEKQIVGLQEIHERELKEREAALETYRNALEVLEREYRADLRRIEENTEKERETFEESHTERPTEIIQEIEQQFGFEYVE